MKEKRNNSRYFCNVECEWYPCHAVEEDTGFNCLFCYCPLYPYRQCGGDYVMLENGWKDCSACTLPHHAEQYDEVLGRLRRIHCDFL